MEDLIERAKSPEEINMLSPLTWAYVGDCIYELYIRTDLVNKTKLKPHKLHIETIKYVKAKAQADILKRIEENLTENAENHHLPKNADPADYMYSTAFEGLIGYLYLTKQDERLKEIFKMCKE